MTDLPLCEPQVHLSATLSSHSLVFLQRATNDTGRNGQVTVVAGIAVSPVIREGEPEALRDASGFPRERHCV